MEPLSPANIISLKNAVKRVYKFQRDLQQKQSIAKHIKLPQVPAVLSESLAYYLLKKHNVIPELSAATLSINRKRADILAARGSKTYTIEVKASGSQGFQRFREKDVAADYLIWLHFGEFFEPGTNIPIAIHVIAKPGTFFKSGQEVFVSKLKDKVGPTLKSCTFELSDIIS